MPATNPWPLLPPKSTELRLEHFDEDVYRTDSTTLLYKFIDAICGDSGAGALKKQVFLARLGGALENIYFSDLDYIFGNIHFMSRASSESYTYDPSVDMLTSDQWDEISVKDAWYRDRIKNFFIACSLGGTPDGIRMACLAATSVDCDIYEVWRYHRNFGLGEYLGRSPYTADNEFVVRPHKSSLSPREERLLYQMFDKIRPYDSIATIDVNGLSVSAPVLIRAVASDSTYYEVQKIITPTPALQNLPPPELLAIDLLPSEKWALKGSPELAPYAAFNITQEYGYYYLVSGGYRSPIDSVDYGTLNPDGTVTREVPFEVFETTGEYSDWRIYELADSPDNYPGGKFGRTPDRSPAVNADGSLYVFGFESQQEYVDEEKERIQTLGGVADDYRYRLPIQKKSQSKRVFKPELAIAYNPPTRDSTITSSWTNRRPRTFGAEFKLSFLRA
jgi:hypothetical protein